jgi:hypothetical protein
MKKVIVILPLLGFLFFFSNSCQEDPQPEPPGRVIIIPKSDEFAQEEHGIDAVPESDGIFLEWRPNQEKNLTGYIIYRSDFFNKNYLEVGRVGEVYQQIDTTFIDESVDLNKTYYYFVRAIDDLDQVGDPSDTVDYKLLEKPQLLSPTGVLDSLPDFRWNYLDPIPPNEFVFRLQKKINQNVFEYIGVTVRTISYSFPETWNLKDLGITENLSKGEYLWRIDPFGINQGSESAWTRFIMN